MTEEKIVCPKCHSEQITANPRGFSNVRGILGMVSGEGMASGMMGSGRIVITCLKCGKTFKPGAGALKQIDENDNKTITIQQPEVKDNSTAIVIFFIVVAMILFLIILLHSFLA